MTNSDDKRRWLIDARDCLSSAVRDTKEEGWRAAAQSAQLAVELSCKASIALFAEPTWTHDPSDQLRDIVGQRRDELSELGGEDLPEALIRLAEDANFAEPWHGYSTYGQKLDDGRWIAATKVCTEEAARDLLERARRSVETAERLADLFQ